MSISALFGTRVVLKPNLAQFSSSTLGERGAATAVIECSSRPQKKGTKHHMKTRPKKTAKWELKRRPTVYAPLPPLPSEWSFVTDETNTEEATVQVENNDNV
ncbi:hypothetical protein IFM89_035675 [Coptis chinensis]|uniref:50S ribosomal protein 6, chloroplastic n=1 Tax=Coptis chinensis TaxID=261450 RepID=A0A835M893_9MAGN|nr:hypothetical protein IFM89_035675 [Coptis chinensis]